MPQAYDAGRRAVVPWIGFAVRLIAAAFWVLAGALKLPDLRGFSLQIERYEILPQFLVQPVAIILPVLEILLGLYFAGGLFVRFSGLVGTLLFAIFLGGQIQALIRGLVLDCGCFGTFLTSQVSPLTLVRDFALGIPTFLMLAFPARRASLDSRLFGARDAFSRNT